MPPSRFELSTPGLRDQPVANELNVTREARAKKLVESWNDSLRCLLELTEELQIKSTCFSLKLILKSGFWKNELGYKTIMF